MGNTKISWADKTWNPVTGCTPVSTGCKNCYAAKMAKRLDGRFGYPADEPFRPGAIHENAFAEPSKWKKPRKIFVCSMGDLFHESVKDKTLRYLWDIMWGHNRHTFLVLTKRPERMSDFIHNWARSRHFGWVEADRDPIHPGDLFDITDMFERDICGWAYSQTELHNGYGCQHPENDMHTRKQVGECCPCYCPIAEELDEECQEGHPNYMYPDSGIMRLYSRPRFAFADNVWIGVSVEDQKTANERIPILRHIPAVRRFVSIEPMLGPVDLTKIARQYDAEDDEEEKTLNSLQGHTYESMRERCKNNTTGDFINMKLDWVICGGETGLKARPIHPDWVRSLRDQCVEAEVPFFFKQWGKSTVGCLIDGVDWKQFPWEVKNETTC